MSKRLGNHAKIIISRRFLNFLKLKRGVTLLSHTLKEELYEIYHQVTGSFLNQMARWILKENAKG